MRQFTTFLAIALVVLVASVGSAPAATMSALGPFTNGGLDYYVLQADITGITADAIDLNAVSPGGAFVHSEVLTFLLENVSNPPGTFAANTDFLAANTTAVGFNGVIISADNPNQLQGTAATLGFNINDLALTTVNFAQLVVPIGHVPAPGEVIGRLFDDGNQIGQTYDLFIPEPSTMLLGGLGLVGLLAGRRRS